MIASGKQSSSRFFLKLISFFLAVTLWFYVLNSEQLVVEAKFPISIEEPKGLAVSSKLPDYITVRLAGSRAFISKVDLPDEPIIISLSKSEIRNRQALIRFKESMIPAPFGVKIQEIYPSSLEVELDKIAQKKVPVKVRYTGELDSKLKLVSSHVYPDKVSLKGPRSVLREMDFVSTSFINLADLKVDGTIAVEVSSDDSRVQINEKNNTVNFEYKVRSKSSNFSMAQVPIFFLSQTKSYRASHSNVDLELLVIDKESRELKKEDVRVIAEVSSGEKLQEIKLKAELPRDVHLVSIRPEVIEVKLKK